MTLRPYQQEAHDAIIEWVKKTSSSCLIEAATGCHAAGHPIMMHDGTIKRVEDVLLGDMLMGPDSKPRKVVRLHRGTDMIYQVTPVKGQPFVVNGGHIMSVYITPRKKGMQSTIQEISVYDYLSKNKSFKHRTKLYSPEVVYFGNNDVKIDPWILGAAIGDGCLRTTPEITTPDDEIVQYLNQWGFENGFTISKRSSGRACPSYSICDRDANRSSRNRFAVSLDDLGLWGKLSESKFIPDEYKYGSVETRLNLIAGLIDTDGHLYRAGYDWISKSEVLADDLIFVCRSVGLSAYKNKCQKSCQNNFTGTYYRVSISGDCSIIPCKVIRKKSSKRKQKKNNRVTGFSISEAGVGNYYGFELDGDHLYLDGNFIVHHNSGKSHIIAAVSETIHRISQGKHILCLAPSAELVVQNSEKYKTRGFKASIFSASAGEKSLRHPVVFGTPGTVKNKIDRFGSQFAAVVLDEAHAITPTVKGIISEMKARNPNLRVIGMTATPYRMGTGYIFATWPDGNPVGEHETRHPYFTRLVYRIPAQSLINQGYLTPPKVGGISVDHYETLDMQVNSRGQFDKADVERAYIGQGRKTSAIIADIVVQARERQGVMIFAATVRHAKECMDSLPPGLSALVTGETPKKERDKILTRFKAREIKYLVNVAVLTTGFDAPHVDVVALLRATESPGLLQQIIGRGLRLDDAKDDCLILDYAQNLERHCPDGDIFNPTMKMSRGPGDKTITVPCHVCNTKNQFKARSNHEGYAIDDDGFFLDLTGSRVQIDGEDYPAHFGRRCFGHILVNGVYERCSHRWNPKVCPHCKHENDIAARYCEACKGELVDPNEKLRLAFTTLKKDPTRIQTDVVTHWGVSPSVSRSGNKVLRVDIGTPHRKFSYWVMVDPQNYAQERALALFRSLDGKIPATVTYKKEEESNFYRVYAYNKPHDKEPT